MTTYKLIDGISEPQQIQVVRRKNGVVQYATARLVPGVLYEAEADDLFIKSLHSAKVTKRYSDALLAELDAGGIKYTNERARCCGGRRKVLSYEIVEVIEADDAEPD